MTATYTFRFQTTAYPKYVHETTAGKFVSTYLTSSANARMPAARGAEALVPVWWFVHLPWRSVLIYTRIMVNVNVCVCVKASTVSSKTKHVV